MSVGRCITVIVLSGLLTVISLDTARAAVACSFTAVSGVNFGAYNVFNAAPTLSNGSLTYDCTGVGAAGAPVGISLNRGTHSPIFPNRNMANGAQLLGYNLYLDAALTIIFGNGSGKATTIGTGVVLQNATNAGGFFLGKTNAGSISLQP